MLFSFASSPPPPFLYMPHCKWKRKQNTPFLLYIFLSLSMRCESQKFYFGVNIMSRYVCLAKFIYSVGSQRYFTSISLYYNASVCVSLYVFTLMLRNFIRTVENLFSSQCRTIVYNTYIWGNCQVKIGRPNNEKERKRRDKN